MFRKQVGQADPLQIEDAPPARDLEPPAGHPQTEVAPPAGPLQSEVARSAEDSTLCRFRLDSKAGFLTAGTLSMIHLCLALVVSILRGPLSLL